MATIQWDRLLETCHRRKASDILLIAGSPPLIRMGESWRALQIPPFTAADIETMAKERLGATLEGESDGYAYSDFSYGDVARFRAMAFGYPSTRALLIARYLTEASDDKTAKTATIMSSPKEQMHDLHSSSRGLGF